MMLRESKKPSVQELSQLASAYTKIRGSKGFLLTLISIIVSWISLHFTFGIDPEWGGLNLFLSSEASIALAFYTVDTARQEAQFKEQMAAHQRLLEYLIDINGAMKQVIEQIAKDNEDKQ